MTERPKIGTQANGTDFVRSARQRSGLSMREVARRINVSPATMSAIETGKTELTVKRLQHIADALGVSIVGVLKAADVTAPIASPPAEPSSEGNSGTRNWRVFDPPDIDLVLSSAIEVFVRMGYHGATVRMIAGGSGMSIAGVYHHYPSKQSLLIAAFDLTMSELRWRVLAAREDGATPTQSLANMVEALALFHTHRSDLALIGASEMRSFEPEHRPRIAALRNEIQYLLDEQISLASDQGDIRTPHPHDAGRAISTMCTSLPQWFKTDGRLSPEDIASEYAQFALDMMQVRTPSAE
ncbi:MAG: TetR family transcriptional regulator [Kineosporiaceae bacterium]|nr:TetR family transcriptional regulator [Aeromicrobium sp.]